VLRPRSKNVGAPLWVMTYGDLMSLLLVFFVFVGALGGVRLERSGGRTVAHHPISSGGREPKENIALAEEEAPGERWGSLGATGLEEEGSRGALVLARVFFEPGSDALTPRAMEELGKIAPLLWTSQVPLVISGYVSPWVPKNESLSLVEADSRAFARAMAVMDFLWKGRSGEEAEGKGEPPFFPASGGWSGSPIDVSHAGLVDGRDRVDICPLRRIH